ncbi:MAG: transposase [Spirochaetaceae bacterium]|jgi:putative transposase|nr:transposase [Spirochaetaceae bacterium]
MKITEKQSSATILLHMRKNRKIVVDAYYHVSTHINRNDGFLFTKNAKLLFIQVLKEAKKKYRFITKNFTIMSNHYHLLIKPLEGENLSRIVQWINAVFAMRINRINGSKGHVWGQRFFSRVIESIAGYVRVNKYIDENAVKARLVKRAEEWEYCGAYYLVQVCRRN